MQSTSTTIKLYYIKDSFNGPQWLSVHSWRKRTKDMTKLSHLELSLMKRGGQVSNVCSFKGQNKIKGLKRDYFSIIPRQRFKKKPKKKNPDLVRMVTVIIIKGRSPSLKKEKRKLYERRICWHLLRGSCWVIAKDVIFWVILVWSQYVRGGGLRWEMKKRTEKGRGRSWVSVSSRASGLACTVWGRLCPSIPKGNPPPPNLECVA